MADVTKENSQVTGEPPADAEQQVEQQGEEVEFIDVSEYSDTEPEAET
jgi:hypothetical protein